MGSGENDEVATSAVLDLNFKAAGATKLLNSRPITGHAVDLVPLVDGKARWDCSSHHRLNPYPGGPRYKALGNSMAMSAMRWIGERIKA